MIGIVDYGCGNLRSLENALEALALPHRRVSTPGGVLEAGRLILPGVGHFGHAGRELRARGLEAPLRERAAMGRPLLGICLGMQLLFEGSDEAPDVPGLALVAGRCGAFDAPGLKVPHMGWSAVDFGDRALAAYFVHSYRIPAFPAERPAQALGMAAYGEPFLAAFRSGPLGGFQFHPEKSGKAGLALLGEALTW
ncbi:imidazole glycerol phosphate synthase subunit HisH [Mesoterricola sediminis]|uniref:Imidazole glycerol phosphate synthase subunit HisH n=1 Tax=Mesoterricola sediminis TaxID=2927980 RepID=A0AA48KD08_9BACT|nr:imidazole glycerol phosphate synthase subunit HisH [Mesoterricola sediminis]BDU75862.1 imidazole glycerol phosphate synthase subunit HisH [Mesoterricola sediminis]